MEEAAAGAGEDDEKDGKEAAAGAGEDVEKDGKEAAAGADEGMEEEAAARAGEGMEEEAAAELTSQEVRDFFAIPLSPLPEPVSAESAETSGKSQGSEGEI